MPTTSEIELFPTIAPLGLANGNQDLVDALAREMEWYVNAGMYRDAFDIATGIFTGGLVELENDQNIRRLPRFDLGYPGFWPVLSPHAVQAAYDYGNLWRSVLREGYGVDRPDIRLAVTSMTRPQDYQMALVNQGRFASPTSKHMAGVAFDFDDTSYYKQLPDGTWVSCADPGAIDDRIAAGAEIRARVERDGMGDKAFTSAYDTEYDPRVMKAALETAQLLHDQGLLNVVVEFPGKPYSVLHMAPNPDYLNLVA